MIPSLPGGARQEDGLLRTSSGPRVGPNLALEPTPNSLRSYVAAALGRGSARALGF